MLPLFFRGASSQASSASGNVCRLPCRLLGHQRDGPTHVLRGERHREGGDREDGEGARRPRNGSVPSYRPTQTVGRHLCGRPSGSGAGAGQPTGTLRDVRPRDRSASRRPSQGAGAGPSAAGRRRVRRRQERPQGSARGPGGAQRGPGRLQAPSAPLPSLWSKGSRAPPPRRGHR